MKAITPFFIVQQNIKANNKKKSNFTTKYNIKKRLLQSLKRILRLSPLLHIGIESIMKLYKKEMLFLCIYLGYVIAPTLVNLCREFFIVRQAHLGSGLNLKKSTSRSGNLEIWIHFIDFLYWLFVKLLHYLLITSVYGSTYAYWWTGRCVSKL